MSQNPLEHYRRIQRELRRDFDAFTAIHCPTCPTPCCVRPARITPTDVLLAEGVGWKAKIEAMQAREDTRQDAVQRAAGDMTQAIQGVEEDAPRSPCEYLGDKGCTFPKDLRPFGCTTYLCPIMYRELDRKTLTRMKRLVRELTQAHEKLMVAVHRKHPASGS